MSWLEPLHENDSFLMPAFEKVGFAGLALAHLSRCRLLLRVHSLSEIANGYGNAIEPWAITRDRMVSYSLRSSSVWPQQPRPCNSEWNFWKSALQHTFGLKANFFVAPKFFLCQWPRPFISPWQFQPATDRLFHQLPNGTWEFHSLIPTQ